MTRCFSADCHIFMDINSIIKRMTYASFTGKLGYYDTIIKLLPKCGFFYFDIFAVLWNHIKVNSNKKKSNKSKLSSKQLPAKLHNQKACVVSDGWTCWLFFKKFFNIAQLRTVKLELRFCSLLKSCCDCLIVKSLQLSKIYLAAM